MAKKAKTKSRSSKKEVLMEKVDVNEYWLFNPDGTPTAQTLAAFAESEASHGTRKQYATFDDLLADLDADD